MCLGNLPNEILQNIFIKSENFKVIPFLSLDFNKFFCKSKNSIFKQVFINNKINVKLELAFGTYTELIKLNITLEKLYNDYTNKDFNLSMQYINNFSEFMVNNCINLVKLYITVFDINGHIDGLLYHAMVVKNYDIFDVLMNEYLANSQSEEPRESEEATVDLKMGLFYVAISNNDLFMIYQLIHKYNIDTTYNNYSLLRDAVKQNNKHLITLLLTDPRSDFDIANKITYGI